MKCKRCRSQVPDNADVCPECGQDITSLRELLKNFYEEGPPKPEDLGVEPQIDTPPPPPENQDSPLEAGLPRIVENRGRRGEAEPSFALPDTFPEDEEPAPEKERVLPWLRTSPAGFWIRSMAFAFDQVVLFLILGIFLVVGFLAARIGIASGASFLQQARIIFPLLLPLAAVVSLAYFSFFHGAWGQTIGKMVFGLQVVQQNGDPLTFGRASIRSLAYIPSAVPFFLGFLWAALGGKRGWHDLLAGTMVIHER